MKIITDKKGQIFLFIFISLFCSIKVFSEPASNQKLINHNLPIGINTKENLMSLSSQDISVRALLQVIADQKKMNLVLSDAVSGSLTLNLNKVQWSQALDVILTAKGLGKRMKGNVLMIAPLSELANSQQEQLKLAKKVEELSELQTEYLQINYAKAADIVEILSSSDTGLLSERGSVDVDERTNTLLLKDTKTVIDSVNKMLKVLDVPVRQVVIEARMVTVSNSVGEELGIEWSSVAPSKDKGLNIDLGFHSDNNSIGFQIAHIDGDLLDLELSALESENKGEVIASPRITTANQKTAYIEQGSEIPYTESSSSGATTVSFEKAVLSLEVTPQITPDNKLVLDLAISQDSVGKIITNSDGSESVSIDTQKINTQVLVANGETLVLGGIYQQITTTSETKIPILGDIPFLGWLFRQKSESTSKEELLIFVTPKIVM